MASHSLQGLASMEGRLVKKKKKKKTWFDNCALGRGRGGIFGGNVG